MTEENNKPPMTIQELGIHFVYLCEDVSELTALVKEQSKNYATKEELRTAIKIAEEKHKDQDKAIKDLEDWNLWAQRLVIGAVILAVVGLVLKGNNVI